MTVRSAIGRRGPAVVAMAIGASVTVLGSLLPWVRTGGRRRHSYDLLALVERLGFATDGMAATALRWWPLVPLLAVGAVVAAWWGWPRAGGGLGVLAALYAGGTAVAVARAPAGDLVDIELGTFVTAAGALALLGGSIAAVAEGVRAAVRP